MDNNKFKPVSRPSYNGQPTSFGSQSNYQRNNGFQMGGPTPNDDMNPFQNNNFQETSPSQPKPKRNKKNNGDKKKWLIVGGVLIVAVIAGLLFVNSNNKPEINVNLSDPTAQVDSSVFGETTNIAVPGADGNPVQVKWPSDITPTKMELHLDPVTGSPILMLVGDKTGLGTVVRAHDATGKLTGFWVIVTDEPALNNYNSDASAGNQTQTQVETPTLEQTIYNEIITFIPSIGNETKDQLLEKYKTQLSEVSKKYGKTNEECLDIFIQQYVALNNNQ